MRKARRKVVAALPERLLMRQDALNPGRVAATRHDGVANWQQNFSSYSTWGVDEQVESNADRALRRVLDRHHTQIGAAAFNGLKNRANGWLRLKAGARAEAH